MPLCSKKTPYLLMPTIIEIKAHCQHPEKIKAILTANNAVFKGIDHQVDTYFQVPIGRLKLREGNIENHLIQYNRPNQAGPKKSSVSLYKTTPDASLKTVLTNALGIKVVVDKKRAIYFIDNIKFHVDQVQQLGSFVEIEAISEDGSMPESQLLAQCEKYIQLFGIADADLIDISYSDMLLIK